MAVLGVGMMMYWKSHCCDGFRDGGTDDLDSEEDQHL